MFQGWPSPKVGRHTPKDLPLTMISSEFPLVSVVTPCYNAGAFIAETINSVRAQTYPAVEHIVVDDGSTDGSGRIIARFAPPLTPLYLGQNRGGSFARNRGAERAVGEFLMFLDADDILGPTTIAALVAAVRDRAGCIAYCSWQRLRSKGSRWLAVAPEVRLPVPGADPLRGWLTGAWVPTCSLLWRREDYVSTGGWDEELTWGNDGDLMLRALAGGARLIKADGAETLYRHHGAARLSVSSNFASEREFRSQMRVFEKLEAELVRQGRLADYAVPIGVAYYDLVSRALQQGHRDLAGECLRQGKRLAGGRAISRTAAGRLLVRLLGMERKERIAAALARIGIASAQRRQIRQLRQFDERGRSKNQDRSAE
jgi:glycosyltransferase involved in cell wall biosynthesis